MDWEREPALTIHHLPIIGWFLPGSYSGAGCLATKRQCSNRSYIYVLYIAPSNQDLCLEKRFGHSSWANSQTVHMYVMYVQQYMLYRLKVPKYVSYTKLKLLSHCDIYSPSKCTLFPIVSSHWIWRCKPPTYCTRQNLQSWSLESLSRLLARSSTRLHEQRRISTPPQRNPGPWARSLLFSLHLERRHWNSGGPYCFGLT